MGLMEIEHDIRSTALAVGLMEIEHDFGMGRHWRWATEMNCGQRAGAGRGGRGARKGSPKFISAWVGAGDGRPK